MKSKLSRLPRVESGCGSVPDGCKYLITSDFLIASDLSGDRLRYGGVVVVASTAAPTAVDESVP